MSRTRPCNRARPIPVDPASPDRPVILMTFSGGGSRAAALAEAVLGEMAQTGYTSVDGRHVLSEDVKLISSVSGGSVTAAWFGLHRAPGHWDGDLDALRRDFLTQDNMAALELDAVNPITWFGLATGQITRVEAEEALFNQRLYHDVTLAALNLPGKPYIVLNATDMAGGETFAMVPRRFDDVCSNYDALPVATAVAASAAFPILLTPVSFQDYSAGCKGQLRSAEWIRIDLSNPYTPYLNLAEYKDARYSNDLRHGQDPFRQIDYLNFLDGGLADNLGTQSLRTALIAAYDDANVLRAINEGKIRRLVVIVVNARSDPPNRLYQQPGQPGLVAQINAVTSVPIDANTANSETALSAAARRIRPGRSRGRPAGEIQRDVGLRDHHRLRSDPGRHAGACGTAQSGQGRAEQLDLDPCATASHRRDRPFSAAASSLLSRSACRSARCAATCVGRRAAPDDSVRDQNRDQKSRGSIELMAYRGRHTHRDAIGLLEEQTGGEVSVVPDDACAVTPKARPVLSSECFSGGALNAIGSWIAYSASKSALNSMTLTSPACSRHSFG
jgi:NTE family protein